MRYAQRALLAAIVALAALGAAACDNTTAPDLDWTLQVALTGGSNRPGVGDTVQMSAFVVREEANLDITGNALNVTNLATWSFIGQPGIVTVSPTGLVTALAPGGVAIQAVYAGRTANQSLLVE